MKTILAGALGFVLIAVDAAAQNLEQSVGLGALQILNVKISLSVAGPAAPALTAKTDRFYLDGYNRVDSTGNVGEGAPGLTSRTGYFGFTNQSQVDLAAGTLAMHDLLLTDGPYFQHSGEDGRAGVEIRYEIIRVEPEAPQLGLEIRAGRFDLNSSSSSNLTVPATLLTDTYQLGGVQAPAAPYTGGFTVTPSSVRIGDTPTRSTSAVQANVSGRRSLEASGWLWRAGLVWRAVDTDYAGFEVHGGPALLTIKGSFDLAENLSTGSVPALVEQGSGSGSKSIAGFYLGASAQKHLGSSWSMKFGADWLDAGKFTIPGSVGSGRFDFSKAILIDIAALYRF